MNDKLKYTLLLLFLVTLSCVQGQFVSKNEALKIAAQYANCRFQQPRQISTITIENSDTAIRNFLTNGKLRFYIVNLPDSGWVIVSGDERADPILAVSDKGVFPREEEIPPAMFALLDNYANEIAFIQDSCKNASISSELIALKQKNCFTKSVSNGNGSAVYTPGQCLMSKVNRGGEIKWAQSGHHNIQGSNREFSNCDYSYNKFCPICTNSSCGKSLVGCVATAMAQVMWYWSWPYYAYIPVSINSNGKPSDTNELHLYEWDQMPAFLTTLTPMQHANAVAGLLRDCGYTAHMEYCSDGGSSSTEYKARNALEDYFSYEVGSILHKSITPNWAEKLRDEINNGRPIIYGGTGSGGHEFVVDGYDKTDPNKFHINWGWGGSYNAYFTLDNLNPTENYNYNSHQVAIFGIKPDPNCGSINIVNFDATNVENYKHVEAIGGGIVLRNVTLGAGNMFYYISGNQIQLANGFHAYEGSTIKLKIKDFLCPNVANMLNTLDLDSTNHQKNISKSNKHLDFCIYPNPVTSRFTISSNSKINAVVIFSVSGQKLLSPNCSEVDISNFPPGMYLVQVITEGQSRITKIIKQ